MEIRLAGGLVTARLCWRHRREYDVAVSDWPEWVRLLAASALIELHPTGLSKTDLDLITDRIAADRNAMAKRTNDWIKERHAATLGLKPVASANPSGN